MPFSDIASHNIKEKDLIAEHSARVTTTTTTRPLIIQRADNIWPAVERIWTKPYFLGRTGLIDVKFISDEGSMEEDAVDLGGPRREFFRMLLHSIIKYSKAFEGRFTAL